jgi:hypothetical protein
MGKIKCSFGKWIIDNLGSNAIEKYWSDKNTADPFEIGSGSRTNIWAKCQCGHPDYPTIAYSFKAGTRCPVCAGRKVVGGINDIATTHPDYVKFFKNIDDARQYTAGTQHHFELVCPCCGYEKNMLFCNLVNQGFACPLCSDGISYPNKFIIELLSQVATLHPENVQLSQYKPEQIFDWSRDVQKNNPRSKKAYDIYIPLDDPIIIENHGIQHYEAIAFGGRKSVVERTLAEEQENDALKYSIAIQNGISKNHYVVLDCRRSTVDYIKNSVLHSALPELLCFTENDIDWLKCGAYAHCNLFYEACKLWNNGVHNCSEIGRRLHISKSVTIKYLNQAGELGLCDYEPMKLRPILCLDNNCVFDKSSTCASMSMVLFGKQLKRQDITRTAGGFQKSTYDIHFQYITRKEFNQIRNAEPWRAYTQNKTNNNTK